MSANRMNSFFPLRKIHCERCGQSYFVVMLELMNPLPRPKWFSGVPTWFRACRQCLPAVGITTEEITAHSARRFDMARFLGAAVG